MHSNLHGLWIKEKSVAEAPLCFGGILFFIYLLFQNIAGMCWFAMGNICIITLITNWKWSSILTRHNIDSFSLYIFYLLLLESSSLEEDYLFAKINNMLQVAFIEPCFNFNELKHNWKVFVILCQQSTNHALKTDIGVDSLWL